MKNWALSTLGLSLLCAASPTIAQQQSPTSITSSPAAPVARAAAMHLVQIMNDQSDPEGQIAELLDATFRIDKNWVTLEEQFPGIAVAVKTAMLPAMLEFHRNTQPLYQAELGQFFSANFTDPELKQLADFWGSPIGKKVAEGVRDNLDFSATTADIIKNANEGQSGGELASQSAQDKDVMRASAKMVFSLDAAEKKEVMRFTQSPAGAKFIKLAAKKREIDSKWFNYNPPEQEAKITEIINVAGKAHIEKLEAAKK